MNYLETLERELRGVNIKTITRGNIPPDPVPLLGRNISIYLRVISCDLKGSLMEKLGKYFLKGSSRVLTFFSW